ncbi:MAG: hypothetical protein J6Q67_08535, partial [Clostridia bacterium]|nr:hypothetical protein [Clostridia bacterium]
TPLMCFVNLNPLNYQYYFKNSSFGVERVILNSFIDKFVVGISLTFDLLSHMEIYLLSFN